MHEARSKDELYRKIYHEPEGNIGVLRVKLVHSLYFFTYLKGDYKMAKTNHQTGYRKPTKNPTTNYSKDSHKDFCKRCMSHNSGCPRTTGRFPSKECSL